MRFVYKEALRPRSKERRKELGLPPTLWFPGVSPKARRALPHWPRLWRAAPLGDYTYFAASQPLIQENFFHIGHDLSRALKGDLLVYALEDELGVFGLHLMIYAGPNPRSGVVVYHTGAADGRGQVRVVAIADLYSQKVNMWAPEKHNPHFRGVYRWQSFRSKS